jgi:hypothetical protein
MIIERFKKGKIQEIYKRFNEKGRLTPEGVEYINSWIDEDVKVCFQVMESDSEDKIYKWINYWKDLTDFEVIKVISSVEAKEKVLSSKVR